jgi:hypothetical protein
MKSRVGQKETGMIDRDNLSERVAFRLTAETRRKLERWAQEEYRPLANLLFTIVVQSLRDEEARRGEPFEVAGGDPS